MKRALPGDARLSHNGTVKLRGKVVGFWWRDDIDFYCFGRTQGEAEISTFMRHRLTYDIPRFLDGERIGSHPDDEVL